MARILFYDNQHDCLIIYLFLFAEVVDIFGYMVFFFSLKTLAI